MSYNDISEMQADTTLNRRLIACATQEGKGGVSQTPEQWVTENSWKIVSSPGWAAKWSSAKANYNSQPGIDESVITDDDILATIQPMP